MAAPTQHHRQLLQPLKYNVMSKSLGYIDIAAVKAAVTLKQILEHYGILEKLTPSGSGFRGCCPIHKGSDPKQFAVNLERGLWNCFSECKHGGNNLEFVMGMENCSTLEAAWRLNEWFSLGHERSAPDHRRRQSTERSAPVTADKSDAARTSKAIPPTPEPDEGEETGENKPLGFALENLNHSHPYLTERGLTPETIGHFGIGHCSKGILAGRIAIPIHNAQGQLVANAGRWPGEPPEEKEKYRLPGKFLKTLEVFNIHRAAAEPGTSPLVIVEGFFGVMHLWQQGVRRVVALMGWALSKRQEELIATLVTSESRIVLMLDNDDAGTAARKGIAARLSEHGFVRTFRWPAGISQPDALKVDHLSPLRV
jgi:DNA primase